MTRLTAGVRFEEVRPVKGQQVLVTGDLIGTMASSGRCCRWKQVEHLGARAERLDTVGDRPRVTNSPRGERRALPDDLRTEVPGGQPSPSAPPLREADERLAGLCTG